MWYIEDLIKRLFFSQWTMALACDLHVPCNVFGVSLEIDILLQIIELKTVIFTLFLTIRLVKKFNGRVL